MKRASCSACGKLTPRKALRSDGLSQCERALLTVLVQRAPQPTTGEQLAVLAGYSPSSSTPQEAARALRTEGYATLDGFELRVTDAGVRLVGGVAPMPCGAELVELWCSKLGGCSAKILRALVAAYPLEKEELDLAAAIGHSPTSSTFAESLRNLRRLLLITQRIEHGLSVPGKRTTDRFYRTTTDLASYAQPIETMLLREGSPGSGRFA